MDAIDHNHNGAETIPFQQICPQHGERINRYHACPKCVLEEVRRHESRIHMPLDYELPVPAESADGGNSLPVEII